MKNRVAETPPFVQRLFGENWEHLEEKPDIWNKWFGPDTALDRELAAKSTLTATLQAKELTDANWIKNTLDAEVVRYVCEDLGEEESFVLMWKRTKLIALAAVFAGAAQFPYFLPSSAAFTFDLQVLDFALIVLSLVACIASWYLAYTAAPRTSSNLLLKTKSGLFISTELTPKYGTDFVISLENSNDKPIRTKTVSATVLFTPSGILCPEPLHDTLTELLQQAK